MPAAVRRAQTVTPVPALDGKPVDHLGRECLGVPDESGSHRSVLDVAADHCGELPQVARGGCRTALVSGPLGDLEVVLEIRRRRLA